MTRLRGTPHQVETAIRNTAERDGRHVPIHIEQEPGASGKFAIDMLRRGPLDGYTVSADRKTGSKLTRAQAVAAEPNPATSASFAPWNTALLDELEIFPDGAHDDQVDALAGAYAVLADPYRLDPNCVPVPPVSLKPYRERSSPW